MYYVAKTLFAISLIVTTKVVTKRQTLRNLTLPGVLGSVGQGMILD